MHYNLSNIRRSLGHFLLGKGATALSSLALLTLLARWLPLQDFAILVTMQALVLVTGSLFSFGVNQSLIRYVPELRAANNNLVMYRLIRRSLATRFVALGAGMASLGLMLPHISGYLGLQSASEWLWIYLFVGWARMLGLFLARVLESLLWQKLSQYSLAIGSLCRLVLVVAAAMAGGQGTGLDLKTVFIIELIGEMLSLSLLLWGARRRMHGDPHRHQGDDAWMAANRQRVRGYGFWAYLNSLALLAWGSGPNRLIAARFLPHDAVALYGFADSLANLAKRLMPARMLHGMIRPVLVARYSANVDFAELVARVNLNVRLNAVLLLPAMVVLMVGGAPLLDGLTRGKYGATAALLAAMIGLVLLDGLRAQLELACEVVERNQRALAGNMTLASALLLGLVLTPALGTWGLVLAGLVGEVLSILVVLVGLRRDGHRWPLDWQLLVTVGYALLALAVGRLLAEATGAGALGGVAGALLCFGGALLLRPPMTAEEKRMIGKLMRKGKKTDEQ